MSGVIDERGQQWEHCNECSGWVRIQDLWYEEPSTKHKHGRDLCSKCAVQDARRGAWAFIPKPA